MWGHGALLVAAKAIALPPLTVAMALVALFFPTLSAAECLTAGFPLGYILAAWLSYVTSCLFGSTTAVAVRVSYLLWTCIALGSFALFRRRCAKAGGLSSVGGAMLESLFSDLWLLVLSALALAYFGVVFYIHSLYRDERGALWSGGAMWSDLAFHLNVISGFLYGVNRELSLFTRPQSLIFSGHALSYPFIPDYHAASLVAAGAMDVRWAIMLPSILVMLSLFVLLHCMLHRFLAGSVIFKLHGREGFVSFLAVLLWVLSGSIGGWTLLFSKGLNITLTDLMEDWMQFTADRQEMFWFSCPSHVLLPQRSALFAYPIAALVLSCIFIGVNDGRVESATRRNLFIFAGLLTGIIPLVHAHSFVALGIVIACYALINCRRTFSFFFRVSSASDADTPPTLSWQEGILGYRMPHGASAAPVPFGGSLFASWWQFGIPIILLSLPQLPMYLDRLLNARTDNVSFVSVSPIWRNDQWRYFTTLVDLNFFSLWFRALGFFVPLAAIGSLLCFDGRQRKFLACFWVLFLVSNFVQFQPWDKDNNKLFLVWAMPAALAVVRLLQTCWNYEAPTRPKQVVLGDIDDNLSWVPRQHDDNRLRLRQTRIATRADREQEEDRKEEEKHWKAAKAEKKRRRGQPSWLLRGIIVIVSVSLVLSGVFMGIRETMLWWQFVDKEDQTFAAWVIENTERDAIFVNNDSHIHPITNLAGRQCLFNMAGWIQSHGYPDMWTRHGHVLSMLADGPAAARLFRHYNVSYVVYDWTLNHQYTVDKEFFDSHPLIKTIYHSHKYTIYDVKRLE